MMEHRDNRLVYGIGINDADYITQKKEYYLDSNGKKKRRQVWFCPFYNTWTNLLERCYSTKSQKRNPTYEGCYVCDEWLTFSNFKSWMEQQDWKGKHLDKDLLVEGNKLYSLETCVFVAPIVNTFILDSQAKRGEYPIGCSWHKNSKSFRAYCSNPFTKRLESLGYYKSPADAHLSWKKRKHELACQLAVSNYVTDQRVADALQRRYS